MMNLLSRVAYRLFTGLLAFAVSSQAEIAPSGSLVTSFGEGGMVTSAFVNSSTTTASSVVVLPDGKIVLGHTTNRDFVVYRYLPDGSPDTSFGTGGAVITSIGSSDELNDLLVQPDGQVIAAGNEDIQGRFDAAAVRYTSTGALDFSGGVASTSYLLGGQYNETTARAILLQADGKILLGGHNKPRFETKCNWHVMRIQPRGMVDTTFGVNGRRTVGLINFNQTINDMAFTPEGNIILVGNFNSPKVSYQDRAAIARLTADGAEDSTFLAPRLFPQNDVHSRYEATTCDSEGRILCAGQMNNPPLMLVTRYLPSGEIDTLFGNQQGYSLFERGNIYDIHPLPQGKSMICGIMDGKGFIGRLLENGRFDPSFGPEAKGYVICPALYRADKMARLTSDQWVLSGRAADSSNIILVAVHEGPPNPGWVTVTHLPATPVAQDSTLDFASAAPDTSGGSYPLKLSNAGDLPLKGLQILPDGDDYTISPLETTELAPGASTLITLTFTPAGTTPGQRQSKVKIKGSDPTARVFEVNVIGNVLSFTEDADGDGLSDASEYQLRTLGFDFQTAQPDLVQTLFGRLAGALPNLNQAGYYTEQQIPTLLVDTPTLKRDPETDRFTLTLGLQTSQDLKTFSPLSFTAPETTVTSEGKLEFHFENPAGSSFYRVVTD